MGTEPAGSCSSLRACPLLPMLFSGPLRAAMLHEKAASRSLPRLTINVNTLSLRRAGMNTIRSDRGPYPIGLTAKALLHAHAHPASENCRLGKGGRWGIGSFRRNIRNRNRVTGLPDLGGPASWCMVQSVRVEPTGFLIESLETLLTAHFA